VRGIFDKLFKSDKAANATQFFPRDFESAEGKWKQILAEHSFRDPNQAFAMLREFVEGPGYIHVSTRTMELGHGLLPRMFAMCSKRESRNTEHGTGVHKKVLSDPDRVMTRLDSFITAYGGRAVLFELWNSNPTIFELLLLLFDRSEFLAELAIRTPDLVDELVTSGRLRQRKTAEETLRDLRYGLRDADQKQWLRRYHQAELMRIGLRDILGLADPEQYLTELSALADACLQYAVEVMMRRHKFKSPPFVIIGLGKLGGAEIDYGSDLDVVFVADSKAKDLPRLQRVASDVMDLISSRTEMGTVFQMDARLRPDGEKGLLVNTLDAYEEYYRRRAQFWEIQSLTRTRAVAGDLKLGEKFQQMIAMLTNFRNAEHPFSKTRLPPSGSGRAGARRSGAVSCFTVDWKKKIFEMRLRIEKERTPAGQDELAIKTGSGGLMDAEFVAQALCLDQGWHEPNTLRALERGRDAVGVQSSGCSGNTLQRGTLTATDFAQLIKNYCQLRRVEGILRRWSYEGETVLPHEPEPFYRVSVRCGFVTGEEFQSAVAGYRQVSREVFLKFFKP
jgi:glutamate-ammonia-ligase adenylyltransferase